MTFEELGVSPRLAAKLAEQNISDPTPIQVKAIPLALAGRDVMGLAQTGTGKTAAFGLPLIHNLTKIGKKPAQKTATGLILAPTRELAKQIVDNLRAYARGSHLKINLVVGGASLGKQIEIMRKGTDLLVATPGRLIDLIDRKAVDLSQTRYLVLDEADQMLDMGFIHALRRIAPLLGPNRQTMLFSATMAKQMAELAQAYLTDPERVEVARPGQTADKIEQCVHFLSQTEKQGKLIELLSAHKRDRALVFARTKHGAERLMKQLVRAGLKAASIHGNKTQGQRQRAIEAFKAGEAMVLVATDVAARGIDIKGVEYVYNYDLPNVAENYVHRIGRTARAGASGQAVSFCAEDEMGYLRDIVKVVKFDMPIASGEPFEGNGKIVRKQKGAKTAGAKPAGGGNGGGAGKPKQRRRRRPQGKRPSRRAA
ncbi:MAG: DEAD/DEAH box helicase [Pseudomonadota bacterium]